VGRGFGRRIEIEIKIKMQMSKEGRDIGFRVLEFG
jgi:hypothetical protein